MSTSKRLDLQGIRGIAILSVLGFHFYPQLLPNGYLGVDQFFVLSGFLMCTMLSKSKHLPFLSLLSTFYTKRLRRILPLFYFVILMVMFELKIVYPVTEVSMNEKSALKAIVFASNRERSEDENYFKLLSAGTDLFLHTWSLSVELQFYLIVPFLFIIGELFLTRFKYTYYLTLASLSLYFHIVSRPVVAFNSVFARIWQFLIGMLVYMTSSDVSTTDSLPYTLLESGDKKEKSLDEGCDDLDEDEDEGTKNNEEEYPVGDQPTAYQKVLKYTCLSASISVAFWPIELHSVGWRPCFTLLTGLLMSVSMDDVFLSNRVLNYIGDISYSLYLVHWPVYEYLSAWQIADNSLLLLFSLFGAIILAVLIHETFEKWYLSLSTRNLSILTVCLFATIIAMIQFEEIKQKLFPLYRNTLRLDGYAENLTLDDAGKYNDLWNRMDLDGLVEENGVARTPINDRWCDFPGEGGPYKIAIFGNSYARNHMQMIIQECKHMAYNITGDAEKGCEPLSPGPDTCQTRLDNFEKFLDSAKPDYAFLLTRFFHTGSLFEHGEGNLKNDTVYLQMRSQLKKFLPNIKKKLFILDAMPRFAQFMMPSIVKELKKGRPYQDINKRMMHGEANSDRARFRNAALVKECGEKCQLIDYNPVFQDKETSQFRFFDKKGFSYFTVQLHLSPHGLELVRPLYTDICSKL